MGKIKWEMLQKYEAAKNGEKLEDDETISLPMLIKDWKENIYPCIEEEELKPLIEKMEKARLLYLDAVKDYYKVLGEYREEVHPLYRRNPFMFTELHRVKHQHEIPFISPRHLYHVQNTMQLPDDVMPK